jgi:hypothetical protein
VPRVTNPDAALPAADYNVELPRHNTKQLKQSISQSTAAVAADGALGRHTPATRTSIAERLAGW